MNVSPLLLCRLLVATLALVSNAFSQTRADSSFPLPEELKERPNILWIVLEDTNDWMSCYGDPLLKTPNIDALADRGVRFDRAYMTAGVCSPARSAIITGMYQTTIGAHNHYSSYSMWRGNRMEVWDPIYISARTIPEYFKQAGYYTFNEGKTHYNFVYRIEHLYDRWGAMGFKGAANGTEWSGRSPGQPFFGQIQLTGDKFRNAPVRVSPDAVTVPPYYPDTPTYRKEIARHYDTIGEMDRTVGEIVARLKADGLYDNTVIFFISDHGMRLPRHKQFLYEGGIRVPLILAGPGVPRGVARKDLVSGIDLGPTAMALAGIPPPTTMQGRNVFAPGYHRDHVVAARDRCDYTIDRIRAVVTERYKYLRNFMTDKPYLQPQFRDGDDYIEELRTLHREGRLNAVQARFASDERPAEEFYDLQEDPHETRNLVHSIDRTHALELARHRDLLARWILETDDQGRFPESDDGLRAVVDRWGDAAVNREYDRVRGPRK